MSASHARDRSPHPQYEILEQCGRGGMGIVYKARDKRLNRIVALKFLLAGRAESADGTRRFRREAEAIAALNHPNIATLYEVGEWGGEPFLAMEFLPGGSLASRKRATGASYEELLRYAAELGAGLDYAHTRGIVHRDVKPGNAMFSEHGSLKLVDFGLAKPGAAEDITAAGGTVGTVAYMAPELLRGENATVSSDLYAFGAMLYELAAGHNMFSAKNLGSLVDQILAAPAAPLRTVRPDLPESFTVAIEKATALKPENRFASVRQFLDYLGLIAAMAAETRTISLQHLTARKSKKFRIAWTGAALFLLSGATGSIYFARHRAPPAGQVLVVLPFESLSSDPANQALCDGLQETVTGLVSASGSNRLFVVPASEVRRAQVRTIAQARQQFRADLAITGSAQTTDQLLRLTLNLDDAALLRQKGSRSISIPASESGNLQERLTQELHSLTGFAASAEPGSQSPDNVTKKSDAYSLYLQGVGAVDNHQSAAAIDFLQRALTADPRFAPARAKLAEAYLWKHDSTSDPRWLAMADSEVSRAAQDGSGHEVLLAQAMIRKATGDTQSAIALFRRLLKSEPGNMEAWQLLAETLAAANKPAEAEETLLQAVKLRPSYWPIRNTLGIFYMNRGNHARAREEFSAASALAPDIAMIHSNLGALYFTMSRWPEAADEFEKSIAIAPNALAHSNLGTVRFYQGKYQEAAAQAEAATQMQPANPVNWGNLGDALGQLPARKKASLEAFAHAAQLSSEQLLINPANFRLRKSYALYLAKLGRKQEAIQQIEAAVSKAPSDMNVQFYAARVYSTTNVTTRAIQALNRCKELGYSRDEIEREPDLTGIVQRSNYK